jgi:hypothetical protein
MKIGKKDVKKCRKKLAVKRGKTFERAEKRHYRITINVRSI